MSYINAVVIGGTSGIGKATAKSLQDHGYKVQTVGKDECDVRYSVCVRDLVQDLASAHLWVYSAGVNRLSFIENLADGDARDQYDVNVLGFLRLMRELKTYRPSGASVVAVGSDAAERPMRTSSVYCGTKAALHQSVRCLARELAPEFRINVVAPGMTEPTGMQEYIDETVPELRGWTPETARRYERSQIPMQRRATVEEVASTIVDVLLGSKYMTGSVVTINGGR